jgi:Kef-type K+ transport system membrane component KefB
MFADASLLDEMRKVDVEELLLPLLIQLAIIIAAARIFAWLFRRIGQPAVVGEVVAGLVLGPSVFGALAPAWFAATFRPVIGHLQADASDLLLSRVLTALAQIGLVLLLFLIGIEFDFGHLRRHGRIALGISLAGILLPFGLGVGLGLLIHPSLAPDVPVLGFVLFLGTALSITAIPVLGRIMMELGITRTRMATITISAAAIGDAVGWVLLATVAAMTKSAFEPMRTAGMVAATIGFALFMAFVARPFLAVFARRALAAGNGEVGIDYLSALLVLLLLCSIVTNLIGIFAIFGAFLLGATLSGEHAFREAINRRLRDFVTCFFLPVFFAYTGLRTNIGALDTWQLWLVAAAVSAAAVAGKVGGCALAAWASGMSPREGACVGILMNTRGLMELIVINVGKDLGVIPDSVFSMLVLMAVVTTFMTTPLLVRLARGTEIEAHVIASRFLRR